MSATAYAAPTGKCYSFRDLKWYAQHGCICVHDQRDGGMQVLTCEEWKERAAALNSQAQRLSKMSCENPGIRSLAEDRRFTQAAVADMIAAYYEAKNQGDHFDAKVAAWFLRHRPGRRSTSSLSRRADFVTGTPRPMPLGRRTGRTSQPDRVLVPDGLPKKIRILQP